VIGVPSLHDRVWAVSASVEGHASKASGRTDLEERCTLRTTNRQTPCKQLAVFMDKLTREAKSTIKSSRYPGGERA